MAAERFAKYYNPDGSLKAEHLKKFVELERDGIRADYRLDVWWDRDPVSLLLSYLVIKPGMMLVNVFYWDPVLGVPRWLLISLRCLELAVCLAGTCLLLLQKRHRAELALLWSLYGFHLYLYAVNFSFSRYGESLMVLRYLIFGLALQGIAEKIHRKKTA